MKTWIVLTMTCGLAIAACGGDEPTPNEGSGGQTQTGPSSSSSTNSGGAGGEGAGGDGGGEGGSGGAAMGCQPQDVSTFTPHWTPPQPLHQGVCTLEEIDAIIAGCHGPEASEITCGVALGANLECRSCARTLETAAEHGAIVYHPSRGMFDRNSHGCWAHAEGDSSENGCGAKVKAVFDCAYTACTECTPPTTPDDQAELNECLVLAFDGVCAGYVTQATACTDALAGPIADACPWGDEGFDAVAHRYTQLFCGPPVE